MILASASRRRPEEDLQRLDGRTINGLTLILRNVYRPRGRESECRFFELFVKNAAEEISQDAAIEGLYSSGRSSIALKPYFDISFNYKPRFKIRSEELDLSKEDLDGGIFKALSELVKPGGKIIVTVSAPDRLDLINETFRYLDADLPPETTYLGSLLYHCDCGSFFKTWLFREGGREGPPALQGEKALDETYRIRGLTESATRLTRFLDEDASDPKFRNARDRALSILRKMEVRDKALQKRIAAVVAQRLS